MNARNSLALLARRILDPLDVRVVKLTSNKVRGIDPLRDLAFLLNHKRDPILFDVGANDGETAEEFLRIFPGAQLFAFEPYAACCEVLERKFGQHPGVRIHNLALGASRGTSELNLYSGDRMNSLLRLDAAPGNLMRNSFASTGSVPVPVDTLDCFCPEHGIDHIDILKIDTQGYDLEVLKGAATLLARHSVRTVLLEVNFVPMYERQASFSELHGFLSAYGYRLVDFYNQVRSDGCTAWCDACYVAPTVVN